MKFSTRYFKFGIGKMGKRWYVYSTNCDYFPEFRESFFDVFVIWLKATIRRV